MKVFSPQLLTTICRMIAVRSDTSTGVLLHAPDNAILFTHIGRRKREALKQFHATLDGHQWNVKNGSMRTNRVGDKFVCDSDGSNSNKQV